MEWKIYYGPVLFRECKGFWKWKNGLMWFAHQKFGLKSPATLSIEVNKIQRLIHGKLGIEGYVGVEGY